MAKTVIKIENLNKIYRLGEVGTGTLSHDLERWWKMNILGQEDPYTKVGTINDRTQKAVKGEHVAALRDINLEVKEGEVLGIIGKNGAGKSTLLKILSRVTSPTTGTVKVKGRMASLLEVGTGFHPEMTGRENIYMNGTIMGMRKWEIDKKLDEIVEFAGVAKYLDTPVKRYSSGMTVRLGFAIAAHLEPEILIVDEVLAVGDAEFQKKAIGKMQEVSHEQGRTVLFVSHNMAAVKNLCNYGIVLSNGAIDFKGEVDNCISSYSSHDNQYNSIPIVNVEDKKRIKGNQHAIKRVWIENKDNNPSRVFFMGEKMNFCFEFNLIKNYDNIDVGFGIENVFGNRIFSLNNEMLKGRFFNNIKSGIAIFGLPENLLQPGQFLLSVAICCGNDWIDFVPQAMSFFVEAADIYGSGKLADHSQGIISIKGEIKIEPISVDKVLISAKA